MEPDRRPWQELSPALAEVLLRHMAGITDAVIAEVHAAMPPTAEAGESFQRNLRAGIDAAYRQLYLETGRPDTPADRGIFERLGSAQLRAGRSFDEMQAFYRLSALVFWRRLAAAGDAGELSLHALGGLGAAIIAYIHDLSVHAAAGYAAAQARLDQASRVRREALVRLLVQAPQDDARAVREAALLADWPLPERVAALALPLDAGEHLADALAPAAVAARVGNRVCVVVAADALPALGERLTGLLGDARAAVGPAVPWPETGLSFARADRLLDLAATGALGPGGPVAAHEHAVELLLAGDPRLAADLAADRLRALEGLRPAARERLTATLSAWLEQPDRPQAIADRLGIHVQTVRYRLGQLRALLGGALDDPRARLELALALRASALQEAQTEAGSPVSTSPE